MSGPKLLDRLDLVLAELPIAGDEHQIVGDALCDEHPVERVFIEKRQACKLEAMTRREG